MKQLLTKLTILCLLISILVPAAYADTLMDLFVPNTTYLYVNNAMAYIIEHQGYDSDTVTWLESCMLFSEIDSVDNMIYYDSEEYIVEMGFLFEKGDPSETDTATSVSISANYPDDADAQQYMILIACNALAASIAVASDCTMTVTEIMDWFSEQHGQELSTKNITDTIALTYTYNNGNESLGLIHY